MTKKPYLSHIGNSPDETAATIDFVQYLGRSFGASGALNSLRYYRDLNWISDPAFKTLKDHLQGLSVDELGSDTKVENPSHIDEVADTSFGVHAESLRYIAAIAGDDFEAESVNVDVAESRVANAQDYFDADDTDSPFEKGPSDL